VSDEERVERFDTVRRLRRNWIIPAVSALAFIAGISMLGDNDFAPLGVLLMWLGGWIAPITLARNAFQLSSKTIVEATSRELRVAGAAPIPVEDIKEARVVQRGKDASELVVELKLSAFKTIALRMPAGDADHLVNVLGVAPGQRRASFTLVVPFGSRFLVSLLTIGLPWFLYLLATVHGELLPVFFLAPLFILPVCLALAALAGFLRGKVTVGADGFTTHWYGRKKHHRFAEVESIRRRTKGMAGMIVDTIVRFGKKKKDLKLAVLDAPDTHQQRGAESRSLADTMEGAFDRWKKAPAIAEVGAHLGRGTRSAKEWLAGIDTLVRGGGNNYRIAAMTPEILVEVAKGTESPHDARIGAAAALLRMNDQAHRSTVRIAAEACAEPRTRVALLELVEAEGDEERMAQALARVMR
jgi:hypothetical protein